MRVKNKGNRGNGCEIFPKNTKNIKIFKQDGGKMKEKKVKKRKCEEEEIEKVSKDLPFRKKKKKEKK